MIWTAIDATTCRVSFFSLMFGLCFAVFAKCLMANLKYCNNQFVSQIVCPGWLFPIVYCLDFNVLGQHYCWSGLFDLCLGQTIFLSVWHLTSRLLVNCIIFCIWGSCNSILFWHFLFDFCQDFVHSNWYLNTVFLLFGSLCDFLFEMDACPSHAVKLVWTRTVA